MPKKALTINDFSGGLNTEVSPRDLEPNQLQTCTNVDPSSKGRLLNSRAFADDDTNFDDFGSVAPQIGAGLFVFSNDKTVTDDGANTGDFIVKSSSSTAVALQEVQDTDITITDLTGSINVPEAPQFYAAEGDLYIGGDHSDAPSSAKFHSQNKMGLGVVDDWLFATQTRTAPDLNATVANSTMDITQSSTDDDLDASANNLGADDIRWIIQFDSNDTGLWSNTNSAASDSGLYIEFGGTWLYKNQAESDITPLNTGSSNGTSVDGSTTVGMVGAVTREECQVKVQAWMHTAPTSASLAIYGARLYSRQNLDKTWYLLAEIDFEKGIRGDGEIGWTGWIGDETDFDKDTLGTGYQATTGNIEAPPALVTYETNNGHSTADIVDTVYWKYGVVANSRAYVGNILIGGRSYGDRILKSPVFQYDVFAENSFIDVASNDGDEITALATYGDMLLEFKKKKLYLINISKELEYMEEVRENAGVQSPAAICKTPFGIAWANYNGVWLYNGSEVTQLTMGKISDSDWNTNVGGTDSNNICGYDPVARQLIVLWDGSSGGSNRGKAYVFTFDTGTWHYVSDMIASADTNCTNMVNTSDGKLLIGGGTANTEVLVYGDRSGRTTTTSQIDMETGELNLGNAGMRKTLTNVKVRYKYGGSDLAVKIITHDISDDLGTTSTTLSGSLTDTSGSVSTKSYDTIGPAAHQNKYWFQVKIDGTADYRFDLDEIVLTYRDLGVR